MERPRLPLSQELSPEIFGATPEALVYEILLRLPVISATRCKSLSRAWRDHISHPSFSHSHFALAISKPHNNNNNDQALVVRSYDYENEGPTAMFSIVDLNARRIVPSLQFSYVKRHFPCKPMSFLVGCDAGIVCVHSTFSNVSRIYLWNPVTRQLRRLPSFNIPADERVGRRLVLGFGYDPISDDLKVVRVVPPDFFTEVYSASRNAWEIIGARPSELPLVPHFHNNFDVVVNGFLFIAGTDGMVTFDLNTNVFNCIPFPAPTSDTSIAYSEKTTRIAEFHHSVAVILCRGPDFYEKIELWALDDESCLRPGGVEASWTRMFDIDINWELQCVNGHFNSGDFLKLVRDVWYLYNPNNHGADYCETDNENARKFADAFYPGEIFRYRKSLLPLA